ncbi:hypothetical protein GCM10010254_33390 [Streptomyces chromofuscus]|nr:hypothetical protein GCM10010254_33390 [Streptomyces chromofuscus]
MSWGIASAEISLLRGVEDGDFRAVTPVIVLPLTVICTWTEPYCVLTVAPATDRVVDPPEVPEVPDVPDVVRDAVGALAFVGAVVVRDADGTADGDALPEVESLVLAEGETEGLAEADGDVVAEEALPAPAGTADATGVLRPSASWASDGSVVGLSASSSTTAETVPAPASTARRSGCVFLTPRSASRSPRASHRARPPSGSAAQKAKDSWWIRRSGTPASRSAA